MGEYWVSHKRMNTDNTRIIKVKAMERRKGSGLSSAEEYDREEVIQSIENDNNWFTCLQKDKRIWTKKAEIHIILVNNVKFIRTDSNQTEADNLGELPDF